MKIKVRIMIFQYTVAHCECIVALFVVCFWDLTEHLDPEMEMYDVRLKSR